MIYYKTLLILFSTIVIYLSPFARAADQNNSPQLIEPCKLISKSEAETILGIALGEGQYSEHKIVGQKICIYEASDKNSFDFL